MQRYLSVLYVIGLLFFTVSVKAHQTELSTLMLLEKENNTWVLQINASLTAFQKEIRFHYAETPYKTPEAFKAMVSEFIKDNLIITFNNGEIVTFNEGTVQLGHETKVVFEIIGVPETINSVTFKSEIFKDIYRSQSALVILKEGFDREQFLLNVDNNHQLNLEVDGNKFKRIVDDQVSLSSFTVVFIIIFFIGVSFLIFKKIATKNIKNL